MTKKELEIVRKALVPFVNMARALPPGTQVPDACEVNVTIFAGDLYRVEEAYALVKRDRLA